MSDFPQDQHEDMVNNKRYGKLTIQYEAGKVTTVRKEETIIDRTPRAENRIVRTK